MEEEEKGGICRVCLCTAKKKSMSLFEKYKDSLVYDYINSLTNVQIKENDGLPDKICRVCLQDLERAIHFKQKCEDSNVFLLSTVNSSTPVEIDVKEVVVKKEEPQETSLEFIETENDYFDSSELYDGDLVTTKREKKSGNKINLGLHKSRAIDLKLQCDDCGEYFKSKCKIRVHWKQVHYKQNLICQDCKRTFKTITAFNKHEKNRRKSCSAATNFRIEGEGKSRVFYCKECSYKSARIKDIITHWVIHTGDRPYKCDLCPKTCTQQSSLAAHKESAHKDYKAEITCQYCGKYIKGRNKIYRHLKTHSDKGMTCPVCQKILKNRNSLNQHMQRHSGVKSYTCEKCAHSFYTGAELSNHKRMVHNKANKVWFKCELCDYKNYRKECVKRHKAKHTDTNVPCTVCGMFFESSQKLLLHQRRHFEEKKYSCPHCDMKFYRRDTVPRHIKAKHKFMMPTAPPTQRIGFTIKEECIDIYRKP